MQTQSKNTHRFRPARWIAGLGAACGLVAGAWSQEKPPALVVETLAGVACTPGEDQRYWYPRVPPYVGYAKGEPLSAGGGGDCYVGFPGTGADAIVKVDGEQVELRPRQTNPPRGRQQYTSADGRVRVDIVVTGVETTCEPGADNCCGDYTFARITVSMGGRSASVRAVRYQGG